LEKTKAYNIPKSLVVRAFKLVKANAGSAGVDRQSLEDFERNRKDNLYKIWNRMSSGSYFPPPVRAVAIPKKAGGERILGIPTVADRVAQMVVKLTFEPQVEKYFLSDSYGYRPSKSALEAVAVTRKRCWKYDWVLEFDIVGLFDHIPHELLMKAVRKHTRENWLILYIERWLRAPIQQSNGKVVTRDKGTPQGGVISPLLSNLYLHYVFDVWMGQKHPDNLWCRYADDGLVHCKTLEEAQQLSEALEERFKQCGLELHPEKTRIIYCKDDNRRDSYTTNSFDFLGYTFRPRVCRNKRENKLFISFSPAASKHAQKAMRKRIKELNWRNRANRSLEEIAKYMNPILRGWLNYYGKFHSSALYSVWRHFNKTLVAWAMCKYKRLKGHKTQAGKFLQRIAENQSQLFVHWRVGMLGTFA
jgi:RNA-directed DNA polymerase